MIRRPPRSTRTDTLFPYTTLFRSLLAPSTGTIIARVREPGSMVVRQSPVYSLSLDRPVYVRSYVGESDLGRISPAIRVRLCSDSSDKTYQVQISVISPLPEFPPKQLETTDQHTDRVSTLPTVPPTPHPPS